MRAAVVGMWLALACAAQNAGQQIRVAAGKSVVIDSPWDIARVAVGSGDIADAVAVSEREVMLNGKAQGETSLVIWPKTGAERLAYDVTVEPPPGRIEALRRRIQEEVGESVNLDVDDAAVFVRGTVRNEAEGRRALAIAGVLGTVVNLLNISTPPGDPQVMLKVRFADIDRSAASQLGVNFVSTGGNNKTPGIISTQQFSPPTVNQVAGSAGQFNLSDALNIFLYRPDLNIGATIKALEAKNLAQILAEPNVLATAGKPASFLAGGEFPYPVVQSGVAGYNTVTIQFHEFGVRINFTATFTPRGTIKLAVEPEVSALDYTNGLVYQGFNIPALSVRRMKTEVELANDQSFAIAGLLDNRLTETFNKIPGLGDVPFFGKLFQSRSYNRSNSELLVVVTPELVDPIAAGTAPEGLEMPKPFLNDGSAAVPGSNPTSERELPVRPQIPLELPQEKPAVAAPAPAVDSAFSPGNAVKGGR